MALLDEIGLAQLWEKIKNTFATKEYVDQVVQNIEPGGGGGDFSLGYTPSCIKVYRTADFTNVTTSYNYYDPLYNSAVADVQKGNLTLHTMTPTSYGDRSNYAVKGVLIGKDIHQIRVNATICHNNNADSTALMSLHIVKVSGDTSIIEASDRCRILATETRTMSVSTIIDVSEGDFICLLEYKGLKSLDVDIVATSNQSTKVSQLCIEAIG